MSQWQPGQTLEMVERQVIKKALKFFHDHKTKTAEALGISLRTLQNKLDKYEEEDIESSRIEQQAKERDEAFLKACRAKPETGSRVESVVTISEEQPMPVRERTEVQTLPPGQNKSNSAGKGRSEHKSR